MKLLRDFARLNVDGVIAVRRWGCGEPPGHSNQRSKSQVYAATSIHRNGGGSCGQPTEIMVSGSRDRRQMVIVRLDRAYEVGLVAAAANPSAVVFGLNSQARTCSVTALRRSSLIRSRYTLAMSSRA